MRADEVMQHAAQTLHPTGRRGYRTWSANCEVRGRPKRQASAQRPYVFRWAFACAQDYARSSPADGAAYSSLLPRRLPPRSGTGERGQRQGRTKSRCVGVREPTAPGAADGPARATARQWPERDGTRRPNVSEDRRLSALEKTRPGTTADQTIGRNRRGNSQLRGGLAATQSASRPTA
jgi:hypothetical protein